MSSISGNAREFGVNFNKKKYDPDMEKVVLTWMAGVLENPSLFDGVQGPDALRGKLKDGIILCNLMNKINPGCIKKINKNAKMPFTKMENIGFFNEAMRAYGVTAEYIFVTQDLFEGANLSQVLIGLRALGDRATANGVKPPIGKLRYTTQISNN